MKLTKVEQKRLLKRLHSEYHSDAPTAVRILEYDARILAAQEIESLNAEIHSMEGWIHTCPKCGFKCKECTCTERKVAELEEYVRRLEEERELLRDFIPSAIHENLLPPKAEYPIKQWFDPPKPGVVHNEDD